MPIIRIVHLSGNVRACLFMLAAMAAFALNDACTKLVIADIPAAQIMALRGIPATLLLVGLAAWRGALRRSRRLAHPMLALRTVADIVATITYVTALAFLPIATASAIFQALPLAVTAGAAIFLRETVGWRRWTAIAVGFVGVLIIVRPGTDGFTNASLLVLASVAGSAARDLTTRRMPRNIASFAVAAVTSGAVTLTGFVMLAFGGGWSPVSAFHAGVFALASVCLALGYVCIVEAMRSGDTGFVAPFRYSILVFAIILGYLVFGDVPDLPILAGAAIVVGSGAYSLYRERIRGRKPALPAGSTH